MNDEQRRAYQAGYRAGTEVERARRIGLKVTCVECGRRFDLAVETEADEWAHGHDCE